MDITGFNNFHLITSIIRNDAKGVVDFLEAGADVNILNEHTNLPPLFLAIDNKNPDICEILCKRGAFIGPFDELNITPLGYLLSKNNAGYQKLDYIKLRIILLLLRYGANPDFNESGMLSSRDMLDMIGYTIKNGHLVTKVSAFQKMDMEMYDFDTNMIIDDYIHINIDGDMNDNVINDNVIEFKDNIDTMITID